MLQIFHLPRSAMATEAGFDACKVALELPLGPVSVAENGIVHAEKAEAAMGTTGPQVVHSVHRLEGCNTGSDWHHRRRMVPELQHSRHMLLGL